MTDARCERHSWGQGPRPRLEAYSVSTSEQTRPADHPLDPLTADEFRQAAAILRRDRGLGPRWRFASIELHEPSKDVLRELQPGAPLAREAIAVCWDRDTG